MLRLDVVTVAVVGIVFRILIIMSYTRNCHGVILFVF